jgi:hypothetical protein
MHGVFIYIADHIGVTDRGTGVRVPPLFLFYSKGEEEKGGEEKLRTPHF